MTERIIRAGQGLTPEAAALSRFVLGAGRDHLPEASPPASVDEAIITVAMQPHIDAIYTPQQPEQGEL